MPENKSYRLNPKKKPSWLKKKIEYGSIFQNVQSVLESGRLATVCEEALCPNRGDCFSQGTATFLILGKRCTRHCSFCAVAFGPEGLPDPAEPGRVAEAVTVLGLKYVVITSVTRDDLPDGGAGHFASVIDAIRLKSPKTLIETLIPDFRGLETALDTIVSACPDVLSHNIETVPRLYPLVRPESNYQRSLDILKRAGECDRSIVLKSGLMLGMGETREELCAVFSDLSSSGCCILSLGQYLQPESENHPVERYVTPHEFEELKEIALAKGIREVASAPYVRSSYHAFEMYTALKNNPARNMVQSSYRIE
ncbi:MAG: lipoyl synthase [Candidatus Latescibacterota bacterium]